MDGERPQSLPHYQRILRLLAEATLILTPESKVVAINPSAAKVLGQPPDAIDGTLLSALIVSPIDDLLAYLRRCSRSQQPLVSALTAQTPQGVATFTTKGGVLEPRAGANDPIILLRLYPKLEAIARFRALKDQIDALDAEVAKRRRVEYDLRAQTQRLEVTLKSIGDAVITCDAEGRVTFMNPVAEVMTAWSQKQAIGQLLNDVFIVVNEHTNQAVNNPAQLALSERRIVGLANHSVLIAKDGSRISIEDTAAPIILDGEVKGAILVFHDVSDRRLLERQLIERAERLEQANRRKNEFLTMLAHELRGPLAPIVYAIDIMSIQEECLAAFQEPLTIMSRQVQHLKRLVDDMLDVSRITRGKMNILRHTVDFSALTRVACSDYEAEFRRASVGLQTSIPAAPIWVFADVHRLTQVLHNLLTNAIKFTPADGSAKVSLHTDGNFAVLQVSDTGIGIDKTVLPDLFEPFIQAPQNLARSTGGLGLGLALVKGIIDLHEGEITADSGGANQGTTLRVRLPLTAASTLSTEVAETAASVSTHRILIIEDDRDAARSLHQLLELLGHTVDVANDGIDGLEQAAAILPDLIVCDIGLPGLDGFAVAQRLRANSRTSSIPLIALTGYGDREFVERAKQAGFNYHITKPAALADIQRILGLAQTKQNPEE